MPVVLYPGPGRWTTQRRLRDLLEIPAPIRPWAEEFAPEASFLVVELAGLPLNQLADGELGRAVLGALQAQRTGNLTFEQVRSLVETLFAEPERAPALSIAQHLCGLCPLPSGSKNIRLAFWDQTVLIQHKP